MAAIQADFPAYQKMITHCLDAGRTRILLFVTLLVVLIAATDWFVGNSVSLGVLYIFPMMLGAIVLRPWETALSAIACAVLRWRFDTPGSIPEQILRSAFAVAGYFSAGLFVTALVKNRQLVADSLEQVRAEQQLRQAAENQLRLFVESSPAAIIIVDADGVIVAANRAADAMFMVEHGKSVRGASVANYLPIISDALALKDIAESFRTAAQCQGRRANGEIFSASAWFSSHGAGRNHISAIVVDSSEEMRAREERNLRHLLHYNRITAAGLAHEVRNISAAIGIVAANLHEKLPAADEDCAGLIRLARGLEKLAAVTLSSQVLGGIESVSLRSILDNLRIIIEPEWTDVDGVIEWPMNSAIPNVLADEAGLLQSLLNLTQNSLRAMKDQPVKSLRISVEHRPAKVILRVLDAGPGIQTPENLFRPFLPDSGGAGLGLYISRAIVRSFGGELRFEAQPAGCCFAIELQVGDN